MSDDDYVPPVGQQWCLDRLRAAYGKHALAAYKQCTKLAELTADPSHSREDYVSIAALYGVQHPELMNAGAAFVSKAAKQAISESWRMPNATVLNPKVSKR